MLHYISVDLLALGPWLDELNGDERLIVALLRSMDSDNPVVRRRMLGQYKQFSSSYIREQLRLPTSSMATIGRRILHLDTLGIIKRFRWLDKRTGRMVRYVKLSSRYWKAEKRAHDEADRMVAKAESVSRAREYTLKSERTPRSNLSDNHKTMIKEGRRSSRPSPRVSPRLWWRRSTLDGLKVVRKRRFRRAALTAGRRFNTWTGSPAIGAALRFPAACEPGSTSPSKRW